MGHALFKAANIPHRLMPAAIALGTSTFTMSAMPGTPAIQNAIPMPFFGTNPFAAPGLGLTASAIMLGFGLWWLARAEVRARRAGEVYDYTDPTDPAAAAADGIVRERATTAHEFDPEEVARGEHAAAPPPFSLAALPLVTVVSVNLIMSFAVLPNIDASFLARSAGARRQSPRSAAYGLSSLRWRPRSSCWSRPISSACRRCGRRWMPGVNAAVLPIISVASLVGFGAVVASLPAFEAVKAWVLGIEGGPLVSLALATNILAALTGSASGGLTIALDALGPTYMQTGLDPGLMHRVAVIGAGTLDSLPHNGAVVTLLAVCGSKHRESYRDIVMVAIVGPIVALAAVIALGSTVGSF